MNHYQTTAIVLGRTDFGEADRILQLLTPDHGKVAVLAKGVRKVKSKLAGGVELFTVNDVVIIEGKGEVQTLRSARMHSHYPHISLDYSRMQLGFQILKTIARISEQHVESDYYELAKVSLESLNDPSVQPALTQLWFILNFLRLQGRQPNLSHDSNDASLEAADRYNYLAQETSLEKHPNGLLGADHIKLARLCMQLTPGRLMQVKQAAELANDWLKQLRLLDAV